MGFIDKAKNAAEDAVGQVKEVVGDITGNDDLKAEGKKDQASRAPRRSARTSRTSSPASLLRRTGG